MIKVKKKNSVTSVKCKVLEKKINKLKKKKVASDEKARRAPRQWQVYLENLITLNKVKNTIYVFKKDRILIKH